jgi:hypothetical protein
MLYFVRSFNLLAPTLTLMACSSQEPVMSAEEFQKPENHAAIERTLASCGRVMPNDPRAANCQNARNAKFALDTAEIARMRRAQAVERESAERASASGMEKDLAQLKNDPRMSAEDFQKPENHAAMERTLELCGGAVAQDTRAPNCRNARIAKLTLDTAEIRRIRRAQALERESAEKAGGMSSVQNEKAGAAGKVEAVGIASR